jgi:hypothetical protein
MNSRLAPTEWLLAFGSLDAPRRLLDETGSLHVAAWTLARARCATASVPTEIPSVRELRSAAREIARRAGLGDSIPEGVELARDCEAQGLLVIG